MQRGRLIVPTASTFNIATAYPRFVELNAAHKSRVGSRSVIGAALTMALAIGLPLVWWFSQVASQAETLSCSTPSETMAQAVDALMLSPHSRVDSLRVVDARDPRYENLFVTSAQVRVDGVLVGVGTWASNFSDFGPGRFAGWQDEVRHGYTMVPVNELAARVSAGAGGLRSPGNTRATAFSQSCVPSNG